MSLVVVTGIFGSLTLFNMSAGFVFKISPLKNILCQYFPTSTETKHFKTIKQNKIIYIYI